MALASPAQCCCWLCLDHGGRHPILNQAAVSYNFASYYWQRLAPPNQPRTEYFEYFESTTDNTRDNPPKNPEESAALDNVVRLS